MVWKECIIRQVDEQEWPINCFGMETGKTMVKEFWINGKYAFLFAKGLYKKRREKVKNKFLKWRLFIFHKK